MTDTWIEAGIRALASQCDGAQEKDNVGFSASHTQQGRVLALFPMTMWTEADVAWARAILPTYRRQLAAAGVDIPTAPSATTPPRSGLLSKRATVALADAGTGFFVMAAGHAAFREAVKGIPGATTRRTPFAHIWVPLEQAGYLKGILATFGVTTDANTATLLASVAVLDLQARRRTVVVDGAAFAVAFPYTDTPLLTALQQMETAHRWFDRSTAAWRVRMAPAAAQALLAVLASIPMTVDQATMEAIAACATQEPAAAEPPMPTPDGAWTITLLGASEVVIKNPYDPTIVKLLQQAKAEHEDVYGRRPPYVRFDGAMKAWHFPLGHIVAHLIERLQRASANQFWVDPQVPRL